MRNLKGEFSGSKRCEISEGVREQRVSQLEDATRVQKMYHPELVGGGTRTCIKA